MKFIGRFNGFLAKFVRSDGMIDVYYGGAFAPDGPGCGCIKARDQFGGDILYWRLPACEEGRVIVGDEPRSTVSS